MLPEQKLSVHQALTAYTLGSAYASFEENIKGSLEAGKLADMTVLSGNPYQLPPEELKNIDIEMTIMNGQVVYCKDGVFR